MFSRFQNFTINFKDFFANKRGCHPLDPCAFGASKDHRIPQIEAPMVLHDHPSEYPRSSPMLTGHLDPERYIDWCLKGVFMFLAKWFSRKAYTTSCIINPCLSILIMPVLQWEIFGVFL
jgi:hypothetical protein